jgi:hypothetical protein
VTHSTRIVLLAQVFISGMMAALMTATLGAPHLGLTAALPAQLGPGFLTAWPIAFGFSPIVGPIAFKLSYQLNCLLP